MFDYPNYSVMDSATVVPSSFTEPSSPIYSAGPAVDSISLIDPAPAPTNTKIQMAEVASKPKAAEWAQPSYSYSRKITKNAESSNLLVTGLGGVFVFMGAYYLAKQLDTSYNNNTKGVSTP